MSKYKPLNGIIDNLVMNWRNHPENDQQFWKFFSDVDTTVEWQFDLLNGGKLYAIPEIFKNNKVMLGLIEHYRDSFIREIRRKQIFPAEIEYSKVHIHSSKNSSGNNLIELKMDVKAKDDSKVYASLGPANFFM